MTRESWSALTVVVARLLHIVSAAGGVAPNLRARVALLGRVVADQIGEPLLALDATEPPPEVDAWWDDRAVACELPAVAVWLTVDAARRLALDERVKLAPAITAVEAWAETVPGML